MSPFEIIPAIDILDGRCVRLSRGRYDEATVYGDDPAGVARGFAAHPIRRLHVVDLDGARDGRPANRAVVHAVVAAVAPIPVQVGGGIRDLAAIEEILGAGADRAILGTVALEDPELVREAARRFPGRIAVGIDARNGRVAVEGWTLESDALAADVAARFQDAGVAALVYTDIDRDGMLEGPNFEATALLAEAVSIPVILSGGVAGDEDLRRAAALADRGVAGAIVGRALYTGDVDLPRALAMLPCS